jgi:hypothetical protein
MKNVNVINMGCSCKNKSDAIKKVSIEEILAEDKRVEQVIETPIQTPIVNDEKVNESKQKRLINVLKEFFN